MSVYAPAASELAGTGVPLGPLPRPAVMPDAIPIGSVLMWMASTAPDNWMLCDGSAISREEYKELFALFSTTYGSGDGSHTFNLPDLRDRFPVGKGAQAGTDTLGETGGGTTHTHSIASHTHTTPNHQHTGSTNGHTHTCGNHTHYCGDHTHDVYGTTGQADAGLSTQSGAGATRTGQAHVHALATTSNGMNGQPIQGSGYLSAPSTSSNTDSFTTTAGQGGGTTGGSGILTTDAGTSYPPYLALMFIIKVK